MKPLILVLALLIVVPHSHAQLPDIQGPTRPPDRISAADYKIMRQSLKLRELCNKPNRYVDFNDEPFIKIGIREKYTEEPMWNPKLFDTLEEIRKVPGVISAERSNPPLYPGLITVKRRPGSLPSDLLPKILHIVNKRFPQV